MQEFSFEPEKTKRRTSPIPTEEQKSALSLVKVYLWFALGLLVTGAVSFALPYILVSVMNGKNDDAVANAYLVMIIVSAVLMLPSMIIVHIQGFRKNTPLILISYMIYAIAMGVLLSVVFLDFAGTEKGIQSICIAFFVTGGIFLLCGIFGALTKKSNLSIVYPILFSILLGVTIISLVNFFMQSSMVYWIADFVLFGVMIVIVMLDNHNIHKIAASGAFENSTNLAIYCAFNLYVDFIWVFVRVLYYIALFSKKK
jgi:uncharacterized protein